MGKNANLCAQQFYDGCFMCAHTCCILAQRYKHVMSHTRKCAQQVCAHIQQPSKIVNLIAKNLGNRDR